MQIQFRMIPFVGSALALGVTVFSLVLGGNIASRLGISVFQEQILLIILGFSIAAVFVKVPQAGIPRRVDYLLALLGFGICLWAAYRYPTISTNFFSFEPEISLIGMVVTPLLLEALRRKAGLSIVIVVLVFMIYALFADKVPGTLQGRSSSVEELLGYLVIDSTAMLGLPIKIVATIVVIYILFGGVLQATGGANWFTDLATALVGRRRGGAAKMAIVSSALFGSISGSAVANVASTGVITIPLMKRSGYSPRMAASFEAVASTGGQLMPPVMGAAAFLMAELLQIPYTTVVSAAIIPSFLFFLAVLVQADLEAGVNNIPPVPDEMIPRLRDVLRDGWYFPIPFAVLIWMIFSLNRNPAEAAFWAIVTVVLFNLVFGYKGTRIKPRDLSAALTETGWSSVEIFLIGAIAGMVIGVLQTTGLGFGLTYLLVSIGKSSLLALLFASAVVCILLGMGMPTTGIYLLVATLAAPPLLELGVMPIAAHFFIFYFGMMSMISPPVAIAAFAAASIAGTGAMATAITSVRVGWPAFIVPFLFVYSPSLLMQGDALHILTATGSAMLGIWLISFAMVGYCRSHLSWPERTWALIAGLLLLLPADIGTYGLWLEGAGAVIAVLWAIREFSRPRPARQA